MPSKKKTTSFSQFDQGKGTAAAKRGKAPAKKPAAKKTSTASAAAKKRAAAKKGPSAEDKLRETAKKYRGKVLTMGRK